MITEDEFSYLTTHPPRRLRSQSHRYGTLGAGVPSIFKFSREEALPALCSSELSLASPDGFMLVVPIWY